MNEQRYSDIPRFLERIHPKRITDKIRNQNCHAAFNYFSFTFTNTLSSFCRNCIFGLRLLIPFSPPLQLRNLPFDELLGRINSLDSEMEKEIDTLRKQYQGKRQPILDAMEAKKKRQNNF